MAVTKAVKFGGSLFAFADKKPTKPLDLLTSREYINFDAIARAGYEIKEAIGYFKSQNEELKLWSSHGVKQYGHDAVGFYGVDSEVRRYTEYMNEVIIEMLRVNGNLPVKSLNLAEKCRWNGKFIVEGMLEDGRRLLRRGYIPVAFGTVIDSNSGYKIMSADDYVREVALSQLKPRSKDEAMWFMDVPVCDKNPTLYKDAKPLQEVHSLKDSKIDISDRDRTGGLVRKIENGLLIARNGINSRIVDGNKNRNIAEALMGYDLPTWMRPK